MIVKYVKNSAIVCLKHDQKMRKSVKMRKRIGSKIDPFEEFLISLPPKKRQTNLKVKINVV